MKWLLVLLAVAALPAPVSAAPPKLPVLIDTDIGADVDDAFALALAVAVGLFALAPPLAR